MAVRVEDECETTSDDYDDSMDGDNASALASAGWGTDEDYGGGGATANNSFSAGLAPTRLRSQRRNNGLRVNLGPPVVF